MCCVRKRCKTCKAKVRVSGWIDFTKSFSKNFDGVIWIMKLEHKHRFAPLQDVIIDFEMKIVGFPII